MKKLVEAFRNIFSTPDLRNRVLFTLALAGGVSARRVHSDAGNQYRPAAAAFRAEPGIGARHHRLVQRRQLPPADDFCARHHALHHGVDHFAIAGGRVALPRAFAEGRRTRPAKDHAIHALSDDYSERVSVLYHRADADAPESVRAGARLQPWAAIHSDDHADAHDRLGLHHVARRADQRPRHRQRDVADYFCGHRGRIAARGGRSVGQGSDPAVGIVYADRPAGADRADGGGDRLHCVRRGRATAHSRPVCQARDGAPGDGRTDDLSAAAREFRWRDSADLREFAAYLPADTGADFPEQVELLRPVCESRSAGASLSTR